MSAPTNKIFIPFRPMERQALAKRVKPPVSVWAEENRVLKKGPRPGPWRNRNNPALSGIMDMLGASTIRVFVLVKCTQGGGSDGFYNYLGREGDHSRGNENALVVLADEKSVKKHARKRIIPLFTESANLRDLISSNPNDTTTYSITLRNGFTVEIGWATSQVSLASDSYPIVILDEIDKYQSLTNIAEAKSRTNAFEDICKIGMLSSPGLERGPIWQEMLQCDVVMVHEVCCPHCGAAQVMTWDGFRWPEQGELLAATTAAVASEADYKEIKRHKLGRYQCADCEKLWTDRDRDRALDSGSWIQFPGTPAEFADWAIFGKMPAAPRQPLDKPRAVAAWFPGWCTKFVGLSTIVAERLEAEALIRAGHDDGPDKLRAWYNNRAGLPYVPAKTTRKEDAILLLRDDRPEGLVPSVPIAAITAIADMQKRGFWYKITAWGFGLEQENWTLKVGFVDSWPALKTIFFDSEFRDINGTAYTVNLRGIDTGGGEDADSDYSRTAQAYLWCYENPGVIPFKGQRRKAQPYSITNLDRLPGTNKPLPGGLQLYVLNSTMYKDRLAAKLGISPTDPGAWHLHSGLTPELLAAGGPSAEKMSRQYWDEFARQMCAEYKDGIYWECAKNKANHYWDCSYMEMALVDIAQVKFWAAPAAVPAAAPSTTNTAETDNVPLTQQRSRRW